MIYKHDIGLAGKYKFEVYSKDHQLQYATSYEPNFITQTGLSYVNTYAFADCFRYISLGSGTVNNTVNNGGTTGLKLPLRGFEYIGGNPNGGCSAETNQYVGKGCGYRVSPSGVSLIRAWRIPSGEDNFFETDYTFREYMVSPGRPKVAGYNYDPDFNIVLTGACGCDQTVYDDVLFSNAYQGKESTDFAAHYPNICNATGAFSRIVKDIPVSQDGYMVVYYALDLTFNTGAQYFQATVKRNAPGGDGNIYNWPNGLSVSGYSSIVHPGIKLINNGDVTSVSNVNQIANYEYRVGESFVPPLGIPFEPSCPDDNRIAYLSTDNIQFLVNDISGGAWVSDLSSRAFSSGVQAFRKDWITDSSSPDQSASLGDLAYQKPYFYRPRTTTVDTLGTLLNYPDPTNYLNSVDSTSIAGLEVRQVEPTVLSSRVFDTASPYEEKTSRQRSVTLTFQFKDPSLSPTTMPVRAIVYGYKELDGVNNANWFVGLDSILAASGTNGVQPSVNKVAKTFSSPEDIVGGKLSVGHYYFDSANTLQTRVRLNWTSPCEAGVDGC
jgi:hypothetical protein